MDLLYQRYASPFSFIDGMIQTGQFTEFVVDFWKATNEEEDDKATWEFFLHRVWEGSFSDFKERLKNDQKNQTMSEETKETTVKQSLDILKNFKPAKNGGEA